MRAACYRIGLTLALGLLAPAAFAVVSAPDHIIYGNATLFGQTVAPGTRIEARLLDGGSVLASYTIGTDPDLGGQFAVRIPMDAAEPRVPGTGRPGDPVGLFIDSEPAGETIVGLRGRAVRLNIDPLLLGEGPSVSIGDDLGPEGNGGTRQANFAVSMNTTSDNIVEVDWTTVDGTAVSAASCAPGIDYVQAAGTLAIPAGSLNDVISVTVCGDTDAEPDEQFSVVLEAVRFAVIGDGTGVGTLLDDDDIPEIRVADSFVLEPLTGVQPAEFVATLSRSSLGPISFDYSTQDNDAQAGTDYTAANGTVNFAPGDISATITIDVLADAGVEPNESFSLQLSNAAGGALVDTSALGVVVDPRFDPAVNQEDVVIGPDEVQAMLDPTAIAIAPDGKHAYVVSESLDAILLFDRNAFDGRLSWKATYDATTPGFETALLDSPASLIVSPDGSHVYVAARADDAIAILARDAGNGQLSLVGNQVNAGTIDGVTTEGLAGVRDLALSADGAHLYAAGSLDDAVAVFSRDAGTGALVFLEAERNGTGSVTGLSRPASLIVSRDGSQVFVASRLGDALLVFDRDADSSAEAFGQLSFAEVHVDGQLGVEGLNGAVDLVQSFDEQHLYVVSETDNSVVRFAVAPDGSWTWERQISKGDPGVPGLGGARSIALSSDDRSILVTGFADDSLTVFERKAVQDLPNFGDLGVRQTVLDDQGEVRNLAGPTQVVMTGEEFIYVVANLDNAIVLFSLIDPDVLLIDGFESP